jgi:hypothetical protein
MKNLKLYEVEISIKFMDSSHINILQYFAKSVANAYKRLPYKWEDLEDFNTNVKVISIHKVI